MTTQPFCPYCGNTNLPQDQACRQCGRQLPVMNPAYPAGRLAQPPARVSRENTVKFSTVALLIGGVLLSWTIIGLVVCWVLAYFSYKNNWSF